MYAMCSSHLIVLELIILNMYAWQGVQIMKFPIVHNQLLSVIASVFSSMASPTVWMQYVDTWMTLLRRPLS
jgi:hypothetical protein